MTDAQQDDSGWTREDVAGVPIRFVAPGPDAIGMVVILPDFDWPHDSALAGLRHQLVASKLCAVLPDVRSWWIDRPDPVIRSSPSPLAFVAQQLAPWIATKWGGENRLATLGVGFGGQGALQLAYRFPLLFPIAAAVSPAIDFHRLHDSSPQLQEWFETQEHARQDTATLRLHPLNWPPHQWFACARGDWRFDGCERLASKLTSIGIPYTADLDTAEGPAYQSLQLARALDFVARQLSEPPVTREIRLGR